jgi:hypothetical protein
MLSFCLMASQQWKSKKGRERKTQLPLFSLAKIYVQISRNDKNICENFSLSTQKPLKHHCKVFGEKREKEKFPSAHAERFVLSFYTFFQIYLVTVRVIFVALAGIERTRSEEKHIIFVVIVGTRIR